MSFCLFELAKRLDIQKKIYEEIDKVFKANGSTEITYEMLLECKYLDRVVDETLRKYPIAPGLLRKSSTDYKIRDSDLVIPKGCTVFVPILGLQRDPDIYENPMEFNPDRFLNSPSGAAKSEGITYAPFGDGPRNCIGIRLAKMITKVGLAGIITKYVLELSDKEMLNEEVKFHPNQLVLRPQKLFNIKLTQR